MADPKKVTDAMERFAMARNYFCWRLLDMTKDQREEFELLMRLSALNGRQVYANLLDDLVNDPKAMARWDKTQV